jgi:hypothetical protein
MNLTYAMKYLTTLLLFFFLCILNLAAQSDFRKGYIIKNNNDTIYGLIASGTNVSNAHQCIYKADVNAPKQIFVPNDIKAYRFIDGKYYLSLPIVVENETKLVFLECLIKGIVSVYFYANQQGHHYFVSKEDAVLRELKEETSVYVNDENGKYRNSEYLKPGVTYNSEKKEYVGMLKYMFRENMKICDAVDYISLNHNSLIKIARDYHHAVCSDSDCIISLVSTKSH